MQRTPSVASQTPLQAGEDLERAGCRPAACTGNCRQGRSCDCVAAMGPMRPDPPSTLHSQESLKLRLEGLLSRLVTPRVPPLEAQGAELPMMRATSTILGMAPAYEPPEVDTVPAIFRASANTPLRDLADSSYEPAQPDRGAASLCSACGSTGCTCGKAEPAAP